MEIFFLIAIPRLPRQPLGGVLQKLERKWKIPKTSRCFYKRATILKMNSFIVIFMDFYHRYGTILWKPLWKEEYFLKKLFL